MTPERPEALEIALEVIEALDRRGIAYHLGGSYASSIHGVPRQTQDVDIVISPELSAIQELIADLGSRYYGDADSARDAVERRSSFNLVHLATGVKVDFFCRGDSPFDRSEFDRAQDTRLGDDEDSPRVRVKSPEDTVLRKLVWFRLGGEVSDRQWRDVLGCLRAQRGKLDREYLDRWASELEIGELLSRALEESESSG